MPRKQVGVVLPEGVNIDDLDEKTIKKLEREQKKAQAGNKALGRAMKYVFANYKWLFVVCVICIIVAAASTAAPFMIMQMLVSDIELSLASNGGVPESLTFYIILVAGIFCLGVASSAIYNMIMAKIAQGTLNHIRKDMFSKMQTLPISYFDSHQSGDIMSLYTNDVDALRQYIAATFPQIISASVTLFASVLVMIYFSVWMLLVVIAAIVGMLLIIRKVGGASSRYFTIQQHALGKVDGYIEETMHGQKVIKVFCHEERAKEDFDKCNDALCGAATSANTYANILQPLMGNLGNILYVVIAIAGSLIIAFGGFNVGLINLIDPVGAGNTISIIIGFLGIVKIFTQQIATVSQQINFVAMAKAGGGRIFEMMDTTPEEDDGYVELVYANVAEDGTVTESKEYTGVWAWKHPHKAEGTVTYTRLHGDIEMHDVDFAYVPGKTVLHDITLYANRGQTVAFVGATGAGKTTITNLINRFYDIEDGKIRYDGININKIKKPDLRRSLGMVLQETNLFTGTIKENIKYGNLNATDEEVIAAAKLANAHDFIMRLPNGYDTMLESDGANLSQGQRQLLSIARTACENAPVLILDEATSSIDMRTEVLVQRGMEKLMNGRTVFIIAHRLSTVRNADVIMVLDHGRIIERGTHEQLLEQKGVYYSLYTGAFELD